VNAKIRKGARGKGEWIIVCCSALPVDVCLHLRTGTCYLCSQTSKMGYIVYMFYSECMCVICLFALAVLAKFESRYYST